MKLYEKITVLRKQRGLSQEELANLLEISRQSVYKWEQGVSYPEIEKIKKLATIFGVSCDALLDDDIDLSAPAPQVSKTNKYRSVFVSGNRLDANHSDYDHLVTAKSKKMLMSSEKYFGERRDELNNFAAARGYDYTEFPQYDLNALFFADENRGICGFCYDGAEQFVLPIENIIEANISEVTLAQSRKFTLSISYFTADGKTDSYKIEFFSNRTYFYIRKRREGVDQINAYIATFARQTYESLVNIRNKITALKAKGEEIKNGTTQLEDIDVDDLAQKCAEAKKAADARRAEAEKKVIKSRLLNFFVPLAAGLLIGTVICLILFL